MYTSSEREGGMEEFILIHIPYFLFSVLNLSITILFQN